MRTFRAWAVMGAGAARAAWAQTAWADDCGCKHRGAGSGATGGSGAAAAGGERGCCGCACTKDGKPSESCACTCIQDGQQLPPCGPPQQGRGGSGMQRNVPDRVPSTVPQAPEDRDGSAVTPGGTGR